MPIEKVKRPDDPQRCQGRGANGGQCWNKVEPPAVKCNKCRAVPAGNPDNYLAEQFQQRLTIECGPGEEIKLLRESLSLCHAMIAAHAKLVKDESTLLAYSGGLSRLITDAEKVTKSLVQLEREADMLLGKPALIRWAMQVSQAISEAIKGKFEGWEDVVYNLSEEIGNIVVNATNKEENDE
jgi:hypothetical protein